MEDFKLDFIGIGAPKSGTSWAAQCLKEHPGICFSKEKEINFFNRQYVFYRNEQWKYPKGINWYKSRFEHCLPGKIKGEFSVQYLADPGCPELIRKHFPDAKLITILRNPAERLYSHYLYAKAQFNIKLSLEQVIERQKDFVAQGFYYQHLQNYLRYFPKEQILVMIYEDIRKDPQKFMQEIYGFLGVDSGFAAPSLYQSVNPTPANLKAWELKKRIKQSETAKKIISALKISKIKGMLAANRGKKTYKPIDFLARKKLNAIYSKDAKNLEALIGRKLTFWHEN